MTIDEDSVIGSIDSERVDVRLEQEHVVISNKGTNKGVTTAEEAEDNIRRAMMKEVSRIEEKIKHSEEKIKQNEYILRAMEEKHDSNFFTNNNGIKTAEEVEEEYNVRSFLAELFNKMDDPYKLCKAILDEMDCRKDMYKKIYVEIQHDNAIKAMMYAMATYDYIVMVK